MHQAGDGKEGPNLEAFTRRIVRLILAGQALHLLDNGLPALRGEFRPEHSLHQSNSKLFDIGDTKPPETGDQILVGTAVENPDGIG